MARKRRKTLACEGLSTRGTGEEDLDPQRKIGGELLVGLGEARQSQVLKTA